MLFPALLSKIFRATTLSWNPRSRPHCYRRPHCSRVLLLPPPVSLLATACLCPATARLPVQTRVSVRLASTSRRLPLHSEKPSPLYIFYAAVAATVLVLSGFEGKEPRLAAVVTLASSLDYRSSKSTLKLLLPLADPAQALNVPWNHMILN